jgi:hypothetical protein
MDDHPTAVLDQAMESLKEHFEGLTVSKSSVHRCMTIEFNLSFKRCHFHAVARNSEESIKKRYIWADTETKTDMNFFTNCVFVDEAGFYINLRRTMGWSVKGTTPIESVATTRAVSHTILGAICAAGVVNVCLRRPGVSQSKKRKLGMDSAKKRRQLDQLRTIFGYSSTRLWTLWMHTLNSNRLSSVFHLAI